MYPNSRNNLRTLIVGSSHDGALERSYQSALASLGLAVVEIFDPTLCRPRRPFVRPFSRAVARLASPLLNRWAGVSLLSILQRKSYDLVIVFKGMELAPSLIRRARSATRGALWININPDDPLNVESRGSTNSNVVRSIGLYDGYFTWSHRIIRTLRERGYTHAHYLAFAYNPDYHAPPSVCNIEPESVSFIGTWDRQRERTLTRLVDVKMRIYGSSWHRVTRRSPLSTKVTHRNLHGKELCTAIYSSTVSLNLLRPQNYGAHNMRTFEIPAAGGLMLTTRSEDQNTFFPEGEASLMYGGEEEMEDQLARAFRDGFLCKRLRRNAKAISLDQTYNVRAEQLLRVLDL